MEIKKSLKSLDIKISKLASELGISRPTLDAYIEYYESGKVIPNSVYQKIFDYLFAGEEINSVDFAQRFDYVKRVMLSSTRADTEKTIENQRKNAIIKNIKDVLDSGTVEMPLINFINLFINNKDKDLVKAIYYYFNYSNGYIDMSEVDIAQSDKAFYSQLAKIFVDFQSGSVEYIEKYYQQLVSKNREIFDRKKIRVSDSDIVEYIKNSLDNPENLNMDILKQMISSREENR